MKNLSFEQMEEVKGGQWDNAALCGLGVAGMIFFTGGWGIFAGAAALTFCLYGG